MPKKIDWKKGKRKNQFRAKIKKIDAYLYRRKGYRIGQSWRDGKIEYCYAYKNQKKMRDFM